MSDPSEYIAEMMHGLISQVQETSVRDADVARAEDRRKMLELRQASGETGVNVSELLKQFAEDNPEKQQQALTTEMDRVEKDAAAAVSAAKEKTGEQLPQDRFPAPIITTGG